MWVHLAGSSVMPDSGTGEKSNQAPSLGETESQAWLTVTRQKDTLRPEPWGPAVIRKKLTAQLLGWTCPRN